MTETPLQVRIAAFDVDHTLTSRDCVVPFMWRVAGPFGLANGVLRRVRSVVTASWQRDRDALKAAMSHAVFADRDAVAVEAEADVFAARVHARHLRQEMVETLNGHRRRGDVVVLVSASYGCYLRPLGHLLGVDHVIATELEVGGTGRLTGALEGANCRGPEKVARLHRWLGEVHGGRDAVHVTAYGDSTGDREMLLDADAANWAGRHDPPPWFPST